MNDQSSRLEGCVAIISGAAGGQGAAEARPPRRPRAPRCSSATSTTRRAGPRRRARRRGRLRPPRRALGGRLARRARLATSAAFGQVTALVNNAGISNTAAARSSRRSVAEYRNVIEVNQIGAYTGIHVVAPAIIEAGGGGIVNISSVNGFVGAWGIAGYVSSKFALRGLTRAAAIELARKGIRVNSIHPGPIDTPMLRGGLAGGARPGRGHGPHGARRPGRDGRRRGGDGRVPALRRVVVLLRRRVRGRRRVPGRAPGGTLVKLSVALPRDPRACDVVPRARRAAPRRRASTACGSAPRSASTRSWPWRSPATPPSTIQLGVAVLPDLAPAPDGRRPAGRDGQRGDRRPLPPRRSAPATSR